MASNEILQFAATDTGTNLLTQAEYLADAQRLIGNQPGVARSKLVNKALRQSSLIAAAVAQFIADNQGSDVKDSLSPSQISELLKGSVQAQVQRPNIIINGGFDIVQRGESWPNIAHFTCTAARWRFGQIAGSAQFTVSRMADAPTPNSRFSLNAAVTTASPSPAAGHEAHIRYALEGRQAGLQIRDKVVTLSFWVKSNFPGTYSIAVVKPNADRTQEETYLATYTVADSGVWEKKSLTIDLSTSADRTWSLGNDYAIKLRFSYYAGATYSGSTGWQSGNFVAVTGSNNLAQSVGNYLRIAEVKLEIGDSATPYVAKPITQELIDVQRYELIIGSSDLDSVGLTGYAGAGGETAYQTIQYPTTMRGVPTATLETFEVSNCGQPVFLPGLNSGTLRISATAAGRFAARSGTILRPIFLDAEL